MNQFTHRALTSIALACMEDGEIEEHYAAEMQYWAHNLSQTPLRTILRDALRTHMDNRGLNRSRIDAKALRARGHVEAENFIAKCIA